jgi:hypothetical protein
MLGELCDGTAPPARGSTPVGIIALSLRLVLQAGVPLRAVPRIFAILFGRPAAADYVPEASSIRWWLQRLGLYALTEPLEHHGDWVWIVDHSVQLGNTKVCVVLGLRLCDSPLPARALQHADVRTLAVLPVQTSTGEIVNGQLEEIAKRTGTPRAIVSDGGSDLQKGGALFARQRGIALVSDAAHHGANLLKRRLERDETWTPFLAALGQAKARTQQTSDACLLAPSLRPKARYMNLGPLLKWSRRLLRLLDHPATPADTRARAEQRYGWLREYRDSLAQWSRWETTVRVGVAFLREQGLYVNVHRDLRRRLLAMPPSERDHSLALAWCKFAREQSSSARPGERLPASSEVLESVFGKWKHLAGQQSKSGITSTILSVGAMVGNWSLQRVQDALEATPVKLVCNWMTNFLPQTVQSERRKIFAAHVNKT